MKNIISILLLTATTSVLAEETKPTVLGVGIGMNLSAFIDMVLQKPVKDPTHKEANLAAKAFHDEQLKKLASPKFEEEYLKQLNPYAVETFNATFSPGDVKLLGLDVKDASAGATYDPKIKNYRITGVAAIIPIPDGSNLEKTLKAMGDALIPQFGEPSRKTSDSIVWESLEPSKNSLTVIGNDKIVKVLLSDGGIIHQENQARQKAKLEEYQKAKPVPSIGGKLE